MPDALDQALVLAHDRWLRALARGLVADPHAADDLAQQTWVKALERRPAGPSLHAWLRTTLVHFVARLRRTDARRARRERAAARPPAVPSHQELHERERLRRALADAVLALEEPYCTTITLRFFDGLPPRVIARRMRLPVETVRTRIKRGLERLRSSLDRDYGGRSAWALPLASLAKTTVPLAVLAEILLVTLKTKTLVTALVCVALSLLIWRVTAGPEAAAPTGSEAAARATPVHVDAVTGSQPSRTPVESASSRPAAAATTGSLLVRVRWGDGTPAPDVGLRVTAGRDAGPRFDERDARTEMTGEARFADLAPGEVTLCLDRAFETTRASVVAGQETVVTISTRQPEPAEDWQRERCVDGIVVDPSGAPVPDAEILLSHARRTPIVAAHSAADGTFELRDVCPMWFLIEARAQGFGPSLRSCALDELFEHHDPTPRVRIRLELQPAIGRIVGLVRDPQGRPVPGAVVQIGKDPGTWGNPPRDVKLPDGKWAGNPSPLRVRTDAQGRFDCDGVRPGRQDLAARASGFGPYAGQADVRAGVPSEVTIDLPPGVTLRGTARDARGNALTDVHVRIGNDGRLLDTWTRTRADGTYELRDLAAGELRVIAASMRLSAQIRLSAVVGATLTWDPVLDAGVVLTGRVIDERGAPLKVGIEARAEKLMEQAATDGQGRFAIPGWQDVPTRLVVRESWMPCARVENVRPGTEIVITVLDKDRPNAFLTGTVQGSDGKPCRTAKVYVSQHPFPTSQFAPEAIPNAETGQFRFGPLLPGSWHLEIRSTNHAWRCLAVGILAAHETKDLGTLQLETPGTLEVRAKRSDGAPLEAFTRWDLEQEDGLTRIINLPGGTGVLETLAPGNYIASARAKGVAHARYPFTITAGARTLLEVTLQPTAGTPLEIVAPPGDASPGLWLRVRNPEGVEVARERVRRSPATGPFQTSLGLLPGRYQIEARTDLGSSGALALEVEAGKPPPPARLELR